MIISPYFYFSSKKKKEENTNLEDELLNLYIFQVWPFKRKYFILKIHFL